MVDTNKIADRASELADQAVQAAGPAIDRAKQVAGELAEKAGPFLKEAGEKAGPYLDKAGQAAAQGVAAAAGQIDKVTGGKYSDTIASVATKIEGTLDRTPKGPTV